MAVRDPLPLSVTQVQAHATDGNTLPHLRIGDMDEIKNLDLKIEEITGVLRNLRSRRNCLPPVSRLPPEVLSRIFAVVASIEKPEAPKEISGVRSDSKQRLNTAWLGWIRVTHVCRHWKQTALADICLWVDVPSITPEWTRESLLRTADKSCPLSLSIRYNREQAQRILEVLAGPLMLALPRIRQFTFEGSEATLQPFLAILSTIKHPLQLERLEFHAGELDRAYSLAHCVENPSRFIQATDPLLLRHLVIRDCKLPMGNIDFPLLPQLRHFELSNTTLVIQEPFAWFDSWVMQALSKMPNLESLSVQNPWYDLEGTDIVFPTPNGVYDDARLLHRLQRVDVTCAGVGHFTALMARIIPFTPRSASVRFELFIRNAAIPFEPAVDAIVQWLKPFAGAPGASVEPLRTISLNPGSYPVHLIVDGWTTKNVLVKSLVRPKISLNLRGARSIEEIDHNRIIVEKLCEHLHVKDVSGLRLPNLFKRSEGYRKLYMTMDAIENLRLSTDTSVQLVKSMTSPAFPPYTSMPPPSGSKITLYLPKLTTLTMSNTLMDQKFSNSSGTFTFTEVIRAVLAERKLQLGAPLERLILAQCRIERSDAQTLQSDGLVSQVYLAGSRKP